MTWASYTFLECGTKTLSKKELQGKVIAKVLNFCNVIGRSTILALLYSRPQWYKKCHIRIPKKREIYW